MLFVQWILSVYKNFELYSVSLKCPDFEPNMRCSVAHKAALFD
jgi:hypothetical protein